MADRVRSREEIVRAALALLDDVGLDRFTMRALAQRLDTYPATIYWHVGSRSEVLSAAGELVLTEMAAGLPDAASTAWDEWLVANARAYRSAMLAHPAVASWAVTHLEAGVPLPAYLERVMSVLARAGFQGAALVDAYNAYLGSMIGWVGTELIRADPDHGADPEGMKASIAELSADEHPTITAHLDLLTDRAFTFRWRTGRENPLDAAFEFAVASWVKGLAAMLDPP